MKKSFLKKVFSFQIFIFCLTVSFAQNAQTEEVYSKDISSKKPVWRQSIACENVAPLRLMPEAVFVLGDNKALQAYHRSGRFLWRTYFKDKPTSYIYTNKQYFIFFVTESTKNGIKLNALNRNGKILWSRNLDSVPEFLPAQGKDGRLFIPVKKELLCISPNGNIKWKYNLKEFPRLAPITLQDGSILQTLSGNKILHLNPFGGLLSIITTENEFTTIASYPHEKEDGFVAGTSSGSIIYGKLKLGRWEISEIPTENNSSIISIAEGQKSEWAVLRQNGLFEIFDIDNNLIRSFNVPRFLKNSGYSDLKTNAQSKKLCKLSNSNGNWYISSNTEVLAFSNNGEELWRFYPTNKQNFLAFSEEGDIYTSSKDWVLNCYRAESRIKDSAPVIVYKKDTFGFATAHSSSYGTWFSSQNETVDSDIKAITNDMKVTFKGENEPENTRRLIEIATDDCNDASGKNVSIANRCQACFLLGYSASSDAREALKQVLTESRDFSLTEAALESIATIGYDPENTMLDFINKTILQKPLKRNDRELIAACEAIAKISIFNGTPALEKGVKLIGRMIEAPFSFPVRKKAQDLLQKLAQ